MSAAAEAITRGRKARNEGNLPQAREHYRDAARLHRDAHDVLAYAHAIRHIADMHQDERNLAEARPLYEEALEIYRSSLDTKLLDLANTVRPCALLHERLSDLDTARTLWQEAAHLYASLRLEAGVIECDDHVRKLSRA